MAQKKFFIKINKIVDNKQFMSYDDEVQIIEVMAVSQRPLPQDFVPDLLVASAAAGDQQAMARLIQALMPLVNRRVSLLASRHSDERDDFRQEGAVGLLDAVHHFDPQRQVPFAAYASLCVDRRILSALRARSRKKNLLFQDAVSLEEIELPASSAEDPEDVLLGREQQQALKKAMEQNLSQRERRVLDAYLSGRTYRTIAADLGVSEKSVDNAMQRVRRKLSASLFTD